MNSGTLRVHRPPQGRTKAIDQSPLCGQERLPRNAACSPRSRRPRDSSCTSYSTSSRAGRIASRPTPRFRKSPESAPGTSSSFSGSLRRPSWSRVSRIARSRQRRRGSRSPNALQVLKALHALASGFERFACTDERARGAKSGPRPQIGQGSTAGPRGAKSAAGASCPPESSISKPPTEKRVYPCFLE